MQTGADRQFLFVSSFLNNGDVMSDIKKKMIQISPVKWKIPKSFRKGMRADAIVYGNKFIIDHAEPDALQQLTNVAMLPGIVEPVIGAPDIHFGYGLPMGAIGAFDAENGVISAGCTGFDINCLSKDAEVLTEFGYRKKISDFEKNFYKETIKCVNPSTTVKNTRILYFLKKLSEKVLKVETMGGAKILATGDHPFLTRNGMVLLKNLKINDEVSVYPFEGVKYTKPSLDRIIDEKKIKEKYRKELKAKNLLPLTYSNEKLPYLLKIFGFALGDGHLDNRRVSFYGEEKNLEEIRNDIIKLGFNPGEILNRKRKHNIKTSYGEVKFERTEYSFTVNSRSLAELLRVLGLPAGNKARTEFLLPSWLFRCEGWQVRLFLAGYFGAELTSPKTVTNHGYNFYGPVLTVDKEKTLIENGKEFLRQIGQLLLKFSIKSKLIKERKEYENKGYTSYRLRLQISSEPDNLIKLWGKIGFEYNKEKSFLANVAVQYLKLKKKVLEERKDAIEGIEKENLKKKEAIERFSSNSVNTRFIERTLYEGRKTDPRIAFNFEKFGDFLASRTSGLGKTGQVWDRIVSVEENDHKDWVYDFTVEDEHHNFIANNFVVSNCGIRMIKTNLTVDDIKGKLKILIDTLFRNVPCGVGAKGKLRLNYDQLDEVLAKGAKWALDNGYATKEDLERMEENGHMEGADPSKVSDKAKKRGLPQLGTLGAGNHFLEVQAVDEIYDEETARAFGVEKPGQVIVMLHCGSRGFGHQVASDYLKVHEQAVKKYNIKIPDKQLVCAPTNSQEGQDYFKAMQCAVNYAFTNRTVMTKWVRDSFEQVFDRTWEDMDMKLIYDLCHNIAKLEEHEIDGKKRKLYVHRKGATRALPPNHPLVPAVYKKVGQPVLIAGSMGTASYVLVGTEKGKESFYSTCHGAGRVMSRHKAIRTFKGENIKRELMEKKKIYVKATHGRVIAEEAPNAYKNIDEVIESVHQAGISKKVVRVVPLGVAKG